MCARDSSALFVEVMLCYNWGKWRPEMTIFVHIKTFGMISILIWHSVNEGAIFRPSLGSTSIDGPREEAVSRRAEVYCKVTVKTLPLPSTCTCVRSHSSLLSVVYLCLHPLLLARNHQKAA